MLFGNNMSWLYGKLKKKLDAPAAAGSAGDVLTLGESGKPEWDEIENELPEVTSSDAGKVLKVVENSGSYEWAAGEAGSGLPAYTAEDEGKVLTVAVPDIALASAESASFSSANNYTISLDLSRPLSDFADGTTSTLNLKVNGVITSFDGEVETVGNEKTISFKYENVDAFILSSAGALTDLTQQEYVAQNIEITVDNNTPTALWNLQIDYIGITSLSAPTNVVFGSDTYKKITATINKTSDEINNNFKSNTPMFLCVPDFNSMTGEIADRMNYKIPVISLNRNLMPAENVSVLSDAGAVRAFPLNSLEYCYLIQFADPETSQPSVKAVLYFVGATT